MIYKKDKRLKPCPFCRKKRDVRILMVPLPEDTVYRVVCLNCDGYTRRYNTETEAIDVWNGLGRKEDETPQERTLGDRI